MDNRYRVKQSQTNIKDKNKNNRNLKAYVIRRSFLGEITRRYCIKLATSLRYSIIFKCFDDAQYQKIWWISFLNTFF